MEGHTSLCKSSRGTGHQPDVPASGFIPHFALWDCGYFPVDTQQSQTLYLGFQFKPEIPPASHPKDKGVGN